MVIAMLGALYVGLHLLSLLPETLRFGVPNRPFLVLLFVVLVLAVFALVRGFRRLSDPLDTLVDAVRRVEGGAYDTRVPEAIRGPRELRELARGFNTMASRLEADERRRRALLADVGHELRTPLAVIRGSLEAIVDGIHPADEAHLAGLIDETRVLERLVEDLRTMSLAEAGTLALHREPTDPDVLLGEVAASFDAQARRASVTLGLTSPSDLPILDVDPVRIREVLANLVSNAIRHTPAGGRIDLIGAAVDAGAAVELSVADTGSGIDPELLPHVFDRFAKGRHSRGSGLGLAIARDLVTAHGGTIGVESRPGSGTTFRVRLVVRPG